METSPPHVPDHAKANPVNWRILLVRRSPLPGPVLLALLAACALLACLVFPGYTRYGAHPDELGYRLMDMVGWAQWRPLNFVYPTTHLYTEKFLVVPVADICHFKLGWIANYDVRVFDQLGRILSCIMAFASAVMVGSILLGGGGGPLNAGGAVLLVAVLPTLNNYARFNTTDVPSLFWSLATIRLSIWAWRGQNFRRWFLVGLVGGLAAGVKYLGVLALAPATILLLHSGYRRDSRAGQILAGFAMLAVASVAGFLLSTPYAVFEPTRFLADLRYVKSAAPTWLGPNQPPGLWGVWIGTARALPVPLLLFGLVGICCALRERKPGPLALAVLAIVTWLFFAPSRFYPNRFLLPIHVAMAGLAPGGIRWVAKFVSARHGSSAFRKIEAVAFALTLTWTLVSSAALTWNFAHETRWMAAKWVRAHLKPGERVALPLPIHTYFPVPFLASDTILDASTLPEGKVLAEAALSRNHVRFVMASSFYVPPSDSAFGRLLTAIRDNPEWHEAVVFTGSRFPIIGPFTSEFVNPEITVYEKRN